MPTKMTITVTHVDHLKGPWYAKSDAFPDISAKYSPERPEPGQVSRAKVVAELQHLLSDVLKERIFAFPDGPARDAVVDQLLPLEIVGIRSPDSCDLCVLEGKAAAFGPMMRQQQIVFAEQQTNEAAQAYLQISLLEWQATKDAQMARNKAEHERDMHAPTCTCQGEPKPSIILTDG